MYPWTTLRRVLLLVLLIPPAHFVLLVAKDFRDILNPSPQVWESDVEELERTISFDPPDDDLLVVIGGRQASLWRNVEQLLAPKPVLNAGIGAANVEDVLYYFDRLVRPYDTDAVLYLPGAGDFVVRDTKSPEEFLLMLRALNNYVQRLDDAPHFYIVTLNKWPRYPEMWGTIARTNDMMADWAGATENVTLLDARPFFEQPNGAPVRGVFRNDAINLNEWGYSQLSLLTRQQLETDFPAAY